jgi:quinoprotein glucose dehydrogenase
VPQSDVPGEETSATQPIPTKPPAFDRQGSSLDDLIDFTPALKKEAVEIASQYKMGPLYSPPIVADTGGKKALFLLPTHLGGANWPGGAADPETGMMYVASITSAEFLALSKAEPERSDMGYVGASGAGPARGRPIANGDEPAPTIAARANGPQGLPLVKPPWGRITAVDLNKGELAWTIANGEAPDFVKNHPAMKGIDLSNTGRPSRALLMVTKTLLFGNDGNNLWSGPPGQGGNMFRAYDKATGKLIYEMALPAMTTGVPMTYMAKGKQYIVVAVGAQGVPASLVALALP